MNFSVLNLTLLTAGSVLIWCGITNRNPLAVMRALLTGQAIPERGSWKPVSTEAPTSPDDGGGSGGVIPA